MNINFVLSNTASIDPTIDIKSLKEIGSLWGGWRTWRGCQTDNVICHDLSKTKELLDRRFQDTCNFYISSSSYVALNRPQGVKLYEGSFAHDLDNHEDIVAMHLSASTSDIVLLVGFNFEEPIQLEDKLREHCANNYRNLVKQAIIGNDKVQWVVLDHPAEFRKDLQNLTNLGKDTLINILNA